jgi:RHS repeat-associated protein
LVILVAGCLVEADSRMRFDAKQSVSEHPKRQARRPLRIRHSGSRIAIAGLLALAAFACGAPGQAQTAPPVTLPAMKIGTAALITPAAADSYYAGRTVNATSLATLENISYMPVPPEIVNLARALKNNPDLIYEFVQNNVNVNWMYGLQKGALGTLIDKSGTPFDQATLMIALLNEAGYKANYISGTITLTGAQFAAWTGISDSNAACQMLANGGIPANINGSSASYVCASGTGSAITSVQMAHIWVQATIPGSSCNTNCLFDPSYKTYIKQTGINLVTASGLSTGAALAAAENGMSSGTISGTSVNYVQNLNTNVPSGPTEGLNGVIQGYAQNLLSYMYSHNLQAAQMEDVVGGGVIQPYIAPPGGLRQTTLPYTSSGAHTWSCSTLPLLTLCNVPNQYRTTLNVLGYMWNFLCLTSCPNPAAAYQSMFNTGGTPGVGFFVDEIYGRSLNVGTDYGSNTYYQGLNKYSNTVSLMVDGTTIGTPFTNPPIYYGLNAYNVPVYAQSRGAPAYMTLVADHPYAASAVPGSTTASGTYMDTTITKSVVLVTPLTVVDGWGDDGGWGQATGAMFAKWSDEKAGDSPNPSAASSCVGRQPPDYCVNSYPGGTGDFAREKLAASWLSQYSRAAHLHAAIAGAAYQLHHMLGFAYGDAILNPAYLSNPPITENPDFPQVDNFNRLDVDSGLSMESRTADPAARRGAILAFAASASALEGSAGAQAADLPDSASTATRFEWGNAPPGTANNWDAPTCGSANAYEDPGCPGSRKFVAFTSSNASQAASVALIETQPLSYYTNPGCMNGSFPCGTSGVGTQPSIGSGEASGWSAAYAAEIAAYANAPGTPFTVVTSQETFLGPGQRGGGDIQFAGSPATAYVHSPTKQRGPAFVATFYDTNGLDPLQIAHDIVALGPFNAPPYIATKGGGGGVESNQATSYDPADAADILKSRFVDKSNVLGVNISNGSMGYTAPARIDIGSGGFPYELSAELAWNPIPQQPGYIGPVSPVAPPPGWTTNWNSSLAMTGSGLEAMGKSDVRASVGTLAAFLVAQDIYEATPSTQRDVAGVLVQAWWARQMTGNVVTVQLGKGSQQFLGLPQGVTLPTTGASWFAPGAGFASLTMNGLPRAAYEQICHSPGQVAPYASSRGWSYSGVTSFAVTNAHGDTQTFTPWSNNYSTEGAYECGFAQGFRLTSWTFPQGVTIDLAYGDPIDFQKPSSGQGFDQLLSVGNGLGREIDFSYDSFANLTGFTNHLTGADLRTVSLGSALTQLLFPTSVTDPVGATTTFAFLPAQAGSLTQRPVAHQQLYQVYTPDNPTKPNLQYDYDTEGSVFDVRDGENLQVGDRAPWTFYVASGTRGERDDPLGDAWSVTYDVYGHPAFYTDENGNVTEASADGRGRVTQMLYPEGDCEVFAFDDQDNTTNYYRVDKTSACNIAAGATHVLSVGAVWDPGWNKPTAITDANGNLTSFVYYPSGSGESLLETATRPAVTGGSPVYSFTYDSAGRLLTASDPITSTTNIVTKNAYDSSENLTSTIVDYGSGHLALTTGFGYDANGEVVSTTDPRGNVTETFYDLDRRKTESHHHDGAITAALNAASKTTYDPLGRDVEDDVGTVFSGTTVTNWVMDKVTGYTPTSKVASVTDADSRVTTTTYDGADRVSLVTDPVLRQSLTTYDPAGNVLTETRGLGTQNNAVYATYTYGADNEKLSVYDANGATHITNYVYDGFNRPATTTYPDGSTESVTSYDANSNIISRTNRADQVFGYTYDALNRMATEVIPAYGSTSADTIRYSYDLGGRTTELSGTDGRVIVSQYDTAGRVIHAKTIMPGFAETTTEYTLDANSNRTKLIWPDGYYATYTFDTLNRMSVVKDSTGVTLATYTYDPYSRRTNLAYGASASMAYGYTAAGDLTSLTLAMAGTANDNAWTLGYSNAHQLASEAASITAYKWQPACTTSPCTDAYATVNTLNQYPTVTPSGGSAQTQTFDGNGNLTGDGTFVYSYDPKNRLVSACKPDCSGGSALVATYAYDPLGRREEKSGAGVTTTYFLNDGADEIAEYNSADAVTVRYVPGPVVDDPIAMVPASGTTELFYSDHHGSIVATSDASGNLIEGPFTYDSFGNCFVGTSSCTTLTGGEPFKYTGQYFDVETGLYYYRSRYYDPLKGRFLQPDGVGYKSDLNLYAYVLNDPTDRIDPSGKIVEWDLIQGGTQEQVDKAKEYLANSSTFSGAYKEMTDSKQVFRVYVGTTMPDGTTLKNATGRQPDGAIAVRWNPKRQLETRSGAKQSPSVGLGHELVGHAYRDFKDPAQYSKDLAPTPGNKDYPSVNEQKATATSNAIARELHEPVQQNYFDVNPLEQAPETDDVTGHTQ